MADKSRGDLARPQGLYFGEKWHVPMLDGMRQVGPPLGAKCLHCEEPIKPGQQGLVRAHFDGGAVTTMRPIHRECDLRTIIGGINHQRGDCTCHGGGQEPDPEWATPREAALMAASYFEGLHAGGRG